MQKTFLIKKGVSPFLIQKITLSQLIIWFNRIALATVFCWFGFLKVIRYSPAEELVAHLHRVTLVHVIPIEQFLLMLGLFECLVGVLWLIPKATRLAFCLFMLQMITTFFPLIFLKGETWQNSFALTLTGQYIIKNFVLVASALTVLGSRFPKKTWGLQNA